MVVAEQLVKAGEQFVDFFFHPPHESWVTCRVRYCYRQVGVNRHCGSRSAVEMGGDMRGVGSHLGATATPVSLRQGAARAVCGGWGGPCREKMRDGDAGDSKGRG